MEVSFDVDGMVFIEFNAADEAAVRGAFGDAGLEVGGKVWCSRQHFHRLCRA